jgi:hypothetical protein
MALEVVDVGTTPNDGTGDDLRSAMGKINQNFASLDARIENVSILDFGGSPEIADNSTALNDAVDYCIANGMRRIYFPGVERYNFTQAPNPFTVGIFLEGDGPRAFLCRNYTPAATTSPFLIWTGEYADTDGSDNKNGGMRNIGVLAGSGTSSGTAITVEDDGDSLVQRPGWVRFENIVISGDGTFAFGMRIDGKDQVTPGSQGIRNTALEWVYFLQCTECSLQITGAAGCVGNKIVGGGSSIAVQVIGAGTTESNSYGVILGDVIIVGDVEVANAEEVYISGIVRGDVIIDTSATNCSFHGIATGTYTNGAPPPDVDAATATSGSVTLPNGLRMMWKTVTATTATTAQTFAFPSPFAGAVFGAWYNLAAAYASTNIFLTTDTSNWYLTLGDAHSATDVTLFAIGK